jgi:uncharacterized sulfatase
LQPRASSNAGTPPPTHSAGDGAPRDAERPNLLLIQLDDLGYDDLGVHGNAMARTPTIDRLARESIRFEQFIVNPVCSASRAALLTGRHFLRTGVSHVHGGKDFLHRDEITLADELREAGYATGIWGKWHLGHCEGYLPSQRGFDDSLMTQLYRHREPISLINGVETRHTGWADELLADHAIDFITRHCDRPFFAYVASMTPHTPLDAPASIRRHYSNLGLSDALATLYAMVELHDRALARILDAVERLGLADKTLVLFTSDNGPAINNREFSDEDRARRTVSHMRGWKGDIWQNGVRVPLFMRWPGRLRPRVIDDLVDGADIFPTLVALAGRSPKASRIDGLDLGPLLRDERPLPEDRCVYNYADRGWPPVTTPGPTRGNAREYDPVAPEAKCHLRYDRQVISVHTKRFKLLMNPRPNGTPAPPEPETWLVDLEADPSESRNLAPEQAARTEQLRASLEAWWRSILAEPRSFSMPVFRIAPTGGSRVLAKAPVRILGALRNSLFSVDGWTAAGDQADYAIEVETAAAYRVSLCWDMSPPTGWCMALQTASAERSFLLDGQHVQTIGTIRLEGGATLLHLELRIAQAGDRKSTPSLREIVFEPAADADEEP